VPNASKLRVDLRLFADLIAIGVFTEKEGLSMLANQLTLLMTNDREEHNNLSIVLCFCRHCGDDYAGLVPRKFRSLSHSCLRVMAIVTSIDRQLLNSRFADCLAYDSSTVVCLLRYPANSMEWMWVGQQ